MRRASRRIQCRRGACLPPPPLSLHPAPPLGFADCGARNRRPSRRESPPATAQTRRPSPTPPSSPPGAPPEEISEKEERKEGKGWRGGERMRRRESLEPGPPHPAESAGCTELASKGNIPYVVAISHCCPPSKQPQNLGG